MDEAGFRKLLQREAKRAGSQANLAALLGISAQFITDVLRGRRGPGDKLLAKLGLRREVRYLRIPDIQTTK